MASHSHGQHHNNSSATAIIRYSHNEPCACHSHSHSLCHSHSNQRIHTKTVVKHWTVVSFLFYIPYPLYCFLATVVNPSSLTYADETIYILRHHNCMLKYDIFSYPLLMQVCVAACINAAYTTVAYRKVQAKRDRRKDLV